MNYRFKDTISSVEMDYIIFLNKEFVEIDVFALIRANVTHNESNFFKIINGKINWENVDSQMISENCQEYCNKIQKMKVFI